MLIDAKKVQDLGICPFGKIQSWTIELDSGLDYDFYFGDDLRYLDLLKKQQEFRRSIMGKYVEQASLGRSEMESLLGF